MPNYRVTEVTKKEIKMRNKEGEEMTLPYGCRLAYIP